MRDRIIAVALALLAVGAVAGALWLVSTRVVPDPQAEAEATVDAYLAAWEAGDSATMATMVADAPADHADLHAQLRDALEPRAVRVSRGTVTLDGAQADTDLAIELDLGEAGIARWSSHLTAQRADGRWQVVWEPTVIHPQLRPGRTWDRVVEQPGRAAILAADGSPLTGPGEVVNIGIEPRRIEDPATLLEELGALVPEARAPLADLLARDDLRPEWFYPVVTLRPERWTPVAADVTALPGTVVRREEARLGPEEGFALHTLGRVAPADAEQAAERGVEPGDDVGQYGLEAALEDRLTGTPATEVVLRDRDGDVVTTVHRHQGDPPEPVRTTLDTDVQRALERALVGVQATVGVVVVHAPTGAIRAVASRPLTGFNRALSGRYPPGSTFKVVTASAILTGGTGPDDPVACPGEVVVGGLRLRNAHGLELGEASLREAFARSCNTTFAALGADLPGNALGAAARRFGFGTEPELPLPAFGGSFPEPRDLAERAAAAIGQARVEASPLHLAGVAAAVADGAWRPPYLLAEDGPGEPQRLSTRTRDDLTSMMRAVVDAGTGTAAAVPGNPPVAGKTGTAEHGTADPPETHAWFIGFRGELAFAVLVEGGGEGGEVAAPIAARLLRELAASGAGSSG